MQKALTIAGSDSGGGAGIQADLKTFAARGVYGMSALTAITAQNTRGVSSVFELPAEMVAAQIDAVMDDLGADAWKTGMLSSAPIVALVADRARRYRVERLVVDPVMVAKSGDPLLDPDARATLTSELLPLAFVVTPNRQEAEILTGIPIRSVRDAAVAAQALCSKGARAAIVKGGHLPDENRAIDVLFDGQEIIELAEQRIETVNTHGTGCTFAAAIAAELAKGRDLIAAARSAKAYLTAALRAAIDLRYGEGQGPVDHFLSQRFVLP